MVKKEICIFVAYGDAKVKAVLKTALLSQAVTNFMEYQKRWLRKKSNICVALHPTGISRTLCTLHSSGANFKHYAAEEAIAKRVYRLYNEMYKTGVPIQNSEWDIIKKDGERRTLEFYASVVKDSEDIPTGFRGIVRDITDRKRAEHKLRESEQKYRFMTEQMNDVVWTSDLDMRITYISPSDERILGFTPEERTGHTLADMLTPFSQEKAMEVLSKGYAIETGGADSRRSVNIELEYRHKDGSTRWFETLATGILITAGP